MKLYSPKFESIWTSSDEVGVDDVLVFTDAEVTSSNLAVPVHSTLSRDQELQVSGV
jgi:hypothetical protein